MPVKWGIINTPMILVNPKTRAKENLSETGSNVFEDRINGLAKKKKNHERKSNLVWQHVPKGNDGKLDRREGTCLDHEA